MQRFMLMITLALTLAACQTTRQYQNSSVIDYLYPRSAQQEIDQKTPALTLPLTVGIAFTPAAGGDTSALTEAHKMALLKRIGDKFSDLEFVESIELVPSGYLRPNGSFENVDQLKRMFGLDVIALVSYDQTNFTNEGLSSIAYWTVVGAYVIPAEKNSTHTMMDAVLYDIDSRQLLFRAPGVSAVKSSSTLIGRDGKLREDSMQGLEEASSDLVTNLELQLEMFQKRLKESPDEVLITKREGYKGSGSVGIFGLIVLALIARGRLRQAARC